MEVIIMAKIVYDADLRKDELHAIVELTITTYPNGDIKLYLGIIKNEEIRNIRNKVIPNTISGTLSDFTEEKVINDIKTYINNNLDLYKADAKIIIDRWDVFDTKISGLSNFEDFTSYIVDKNKEIEERNLENNENGMEEKKDTIINEENSAESENGIELKEIISKDKNVGLDISTSIEKVIDPLGFTYIKISYKFTDILCSLKEGELQPIYEYQTIKLLPSTLAESYLPLYADRILDDDMLLTEEIIIDMLVNNKSNSPNRTQNYDYDINLYIDIINSYDCLSSKDNLKSLLVNNLINQMKYC